MIKNSILVIDDEVEVCKILVDFFLSKGYAADYATSPERAMQKIIQNFPTIILLDILIPETNGLDLLKKIKKLNADIGIIMVTGVHDRNIGIEAPSMGASDFVVKPIDLDYLETSVLARMISSEG
ncbi:response regulator [bacterium]|nr:response regulator [bacterium]